MCGFVGSVGQFLASVAWVYKILACVKRKTKGVSGVGRNFCVDGVNLKCFFKKVLLKLSQNLQENTCAGVSCK